ncbi:hypothetical protein D3C87_923390 [compost metagenome]
MKYLLIPVLAGTLLLGGCTDLLRTSGPTVTVVENRASIVLRTQVVAGGLRAAAVPKLTADSINHLVLQIFELEGTQEKPVLDANGNAVKEDLTRNQLSSLITFSKLKPLTKYRIRAYAYRAPGTDAANLISTTDAGSYVDVDVLDDERPAVATLKVKLIDVDFDGQGTFQGVTVTPGGYRPTGPVTISIGTPDPLLNEGTPAHQGMIDIYVPPFKNGMKWTYHVLQTLGASQVTGTVVQEISNVTPAGFTVTTTYTEPPNAPSVTTAAMTAATWYPSAAALRELNYETVTVGAGTFNGAAKLASAENTAANKQYMWLAGQEGLIKFEQRTMTEGGEMVILQTLQEFFNP